MAKERPERREFRELKIELISLPNVFGTLLKNLLRGGGEVAEVLITESSPASYLRLSELRQRNVRVALIYREGKIILPRTDLRVQPGDRLLVVGEPSRIELFVSMVTKGTPQLSPQVGNQGKRLSGLLT